RTAGDSPGPWECRATRYTQSKPVAPVLGQFSYPSRAQFRLRITGRCGKAAPDFHRWTCLQERSPMHRLAANVPECSHDLRATAHVRGARIRYAACVRAFQKTASCSLRLWPRKIAARPPTELEHPTNSYGLPPSKRRRLPDSRRRKRGCQTSGRQTDGIGAAVLAAAAVAL